MIWRLDDSCKKLCYFFKWLIGFITAQYKWKNFKIFIGFRFFQNDITNILSIHWNTSPITQSKKASINDAFHIFNRFVIICERSQLCRFQLRRHKHFQSQLLILLFSIKFELLINC